MLDFLCLPMRFDLKKGFCLLLAVWLLLANVGFAWSQSTCLFTGIQKSSWSYRASCCGKKSTNTPAQRPTFSRASCCHYQHFQVKQHASFVVKKQTFAWVPWLNTKDFVLNHRVFIPRLNEFFWAQERGELLPSVRRALLQIYRI